MSKPHGQRPLRSSNGDLLTPSYQEQFWLAFGVGGNLESDIAELTGADLMRAYQFVQIGRMTLAEPTAFSISIDLKEALLWEKAVYAFVFGNEIVRIGSSKKPLGQRMRQWSRDVTYAMQNSAAEAPKKTNTPEWEAQAWHELLTMHYSGEIYAREAAFVTTPVGSFKAYMDEESILINRHKPRLNRHTNR